jgi:hypothetical protein
VIVRRNPLHRNHGTLTKERYKQVIVDSSEETKAWCLIWAPGQGVRAIKRAQTVGEVVAELRSGHLAARRTP